MKIGRLPALVRTTTFRLALLHASIFILFSASLLAYLYYETAGHLGRQAEAELNAEFGELSAAYRGGGLDRQWPIPTEQFHKPDHQRTLLDRCARLDGIVPLFGRNA